ncbi:YceI family protein [Sphingobium sp. BYY-5]|uniref:YceI family protein n=1 Tax=Sphingobium sp. BYY-5 TaxID=2926400 RepID=UPI001FA6BED3|nr:YceI family protein [Sphingobium sp. BYY-5]MCI4589031.1 YceI family protein [Sphingobium sp. BYY-5]
MMSRPAQAILLLGLIGFAPAAATPPPTPMAAAPHISVPPQGAALYAPGHYQVDSAATKVHFHVKALVGGYEGDFVAPEGSVVIDPARPDRASVDIQFPVEKLTTGDTSTDAMLKGDSFFDMAKFPTVRFTAQDAPLAHGEVPTPIAGELTMHGETRPVTLSVRLVGVTPDEAPGLSVLHFTGTMTVDRSHFDMGFGRPFVSDKVDLTIDAIFRHS